MLMQSATYVWLSKPPIFRDDFMKICLYGSGSRKIDPKYTNCAYELGREIAKHGHSLVFGGGDTGMMGACAKEFMTIMEHQSE